MLLELLGRSLFAATEAVYVDAQLPDLGFAQPQSPGRHDAMLWPGNLGCNLIAGVAVKPQRVCQIGCAKLAATLAVVTVAGGTVVCIDGGTALGCNCIMVLGLQLQHVLGYIGNLRCFQYTITESRHL